MVDKYLVQDRSGGVYETPQFMYIMIALTIFREYPKATSLHMSENTTTQSQSTESTFPHLSWQVRTPLTICEFVLVDVDDTPIASLAATYLLLCCSKGRNRYQRRIRIRGINSKIRGGEVQHTGVVLLKSLNHCRCCTQNGIRGGSATVHFPIWHQEIEDIIVLKNNKGTEDNRVRKLDYSIQIRKYSTKGSLRTQTSRSSNHMFQVSMMLLALLSLTTYM